jgi:cytochrome c1
MPDRAPIAWLCGLVLLLSATWLGVAAMGGPATVLSTLGQGSAQPTALLRRYGCAGCHQIPGVPAARGVVGPSLQGIAARVYLGGVVPNGPDNLVRWIVDPRALSPKTAMPVTGITELEARTVADYLRQH